METWLAHHRARESVKARVDEALKYSDKYWNGICLFLSDGRVELDNNSVERTFPPIALDRENAFFEGHEADAYNWATTASLIETCKLNPIDPQKWLASTFAAVFSGQKQNYIEQLLPRNFMGNWDTNTRD